MRRFYSDEVYENSLKITGDEAAHMKNSLRMKTGDEFIAIDGSGVDYFCAISNVDRDITADVIKKEKGNAEPDIKVTLYQAYPKSAKMNDIVDKAVELGVYEIVPFLSKRCVKRPNGQGEKLTKVSLSAAKQSGRSIVPKVSDVQNFNNALKLMKRHKLLIACYEEEQIKELSQALDTDVDDIAIVIGSEGGFEKEEIGSMRDAGAVVVTLGRRILRTETAGIAVLAACFYEKGQMKY